MLLIKGGSRVPRIAVVNYSTKLTVADLTSIVQAVQRQVSRDFAPLWGTDAILVYMDASQVQAFHWILGFFDNADQAGALGYHDLTPAGKPVMKVFVQDSQNAGVAISSVASHEVLETLADPFIESLALYDAGDGTGTIYAIEVADPVEGDSYEVLGRQVSNFVTPWWFGDPLPAGAKYDYLGKLTKPFTMTSGGYFSFRAITKTGLGDWQQSFQDSRSRTLARLFKR